MGLGDKFFQWLRESWQFASTHEPLQTILLLIARFRGWQSNFGADVTQDIIDGIGAGNDPYALAFSWALSKISNKRPSKNATTSITEITQMMDNPTAYLAAKINQVSTSPEVRDAIASLTPIIRDSVIKPLGAIAGQPGGAPIEAIIEVIASIAVAKTAMHSIGVAAEILSVGQLKGISSAMEDIAKMFPMEEIVAELVRPILSLGVSPPVERFYNAQFRNARLGIEQLIILNHFGVIDDVALAVEAAEEGWRDEDIEHYKQLARARVTPGDAFAARAVGQIDDTALMSKLTEFRYTSDDAALLVELDARKRHQGWNERLFNLALRQFTNYRIDANKLAEIARTAGFPQERIDAEISTAQATVNAQVVELSLAEIEAAFKTNSIGEQEAVSMMTKIHIDSSGIPIILETWRAQKKAGGSRLNAQKLTDAFHMRLIDKSQFLAKLEDIGWNPEDARLIIQIAEWQAPTQPRPLSEATIATAFVEGILSRDQAIAKLVAMDFSPSDAALILKIHTILPAQPQRELEKTEIAKLVLVGVMPEEEALSRYVRMGYSQDDARLLFIALTDKPPSVKKSKPPTKG